MAEVELPNPEELTEKAERAFSRRVALVTAVYAVALAVAPSAATTTTPRCSSFNGYTLFFRVPFLHH